jgi:hypothetical protein
MAWHEITLPKNMIARPGDLVTYQAICNKTEKKTAHVGAPCYNQHMAKLANFTFDCVPCNTKESILPAEDFFLWMKYCAAFGFSPAGTIPYTKDKQNCCFIHGKEENKHRIYAGLCCYRWSECLAPMVWEACRLIEKRPDVSFYRILHFVTGKYVTLIGHSFTNVCAGAMSLYASHGVKAARLDHMWGLYPKFFFAPGYNLVAKTNSQLWTQNIIAEDIRKFDLHLPVKKHEDLLDDKWAELYNVEELNKAKIKAVYNKLL